MRVAAVVLAAGGSARMGRAKQLLEIDGEPLVRRAVRAASASGCGAVFAVLGAAGQQVEAALEGTRAVCVHNSDWQEGLSRSVAAGVAAAEASGADAVLLMLADQPRVDGALLEELIARHPGTPAGVVACRYAGTRGAPALFGAAHFTDLKRLEGDRGAGALLAALDDVEVVDFEDAALDVDTPADYARARLSGPYSK